MAGNAQTGETATDSSWALGSIVTIAAQPSDALFSRRLLYSLRRVLRRHWVMTQEIAVPNDRPADVTPPPGVLIRRGTAGDVAALKCLASDRDPPERRFARGDVALMAEHDGRLVGCVWLASRPLRLPVLRIKVYPEPRRWYAYGGYVLPEFRRRGVHAALQRARLAEAQRVGARTMFGHVDLLNRRAIVAHRQFGWTPREEWFGVVVLDRFAITVWRQPLDTLRRPLMPTAPRQARRAARAIAGSS